ncbi:hypothetical protein AAFF_G00090900 [Aldrovandia affinis]|uniref:Uncharacterized protein n=1 Tax=Aldrovandia affinis TaxID=143900 RepID=A0AAD7WC64_9TELE|nr:hypothetical protein AAFF_G00090900 [Aldrovandia affinis]
MRSLILEGNFNVCLDGRDGVGEGDIDYSAGALAEVVKDFSLVDAFRGRCTRPMLASRGRYVVVARQRDRAEVAKWTASLAYLHGCFNRGEPVDWAVY